MEAMSGHDDDVMSLGMGVFLIDSATPYYDRQVERVIHGRFVDRLKDRRGGTFS
jgi:hypothetical protein